MKLIDHTILRSNLAPVRTPPAQGGTPNRDLAVQHSQSLAGPQDTFSEGPVYQEAYPDLSGFANFSKDKLLAVRDTKDNNDSARVLLLDKSSGSASPVNVDWSQTGRARDLEAVAPGNKAGQFLAVEGSSFGDQKARLFELQVDQSSGQAKKSHVLPEFGQEIEGMVAMPGSYEGSQTVLFAGRGGNGEQSKIYWGSLNDQGLAFSEEGLKGQSVQAPHLADGQRDIADLAADENGQLWATAATDNGDDGPFSSVAYQLGHLTPGQNQPFQSKLGQSFALNDIKAEAISIQPNGTLFVGSDNESAGGRFERLDFRA